MIALESSPWSSMGKSTKEKLFSYIKTGKLHRIRSLFKKYEPSYLTAFVDRRGRTPLHVCCLLGDDAIMRLLLRKGADVGVQDSDGNTPIHFALKYAIQTLRSHAFDDLIVPLLKACTCSRHVFDIENNEGKTPREYMTVLKRQYAKRKQEEEADRKQRWRKEDEEMSKKKEDLEWERKLQFEASQEDFSIYSQDDYLENKQESYDEWVERILRERRRKTESSKQQKTDTNRRHEQQQRKAQERTKELEKEHEAYITRMSIQRQQSKLSSSLAHYEKRCHEIFHSDATSRLKFVDLPWPFEGDTKQMIDLVVEWSELKSKEDQKKFLKDQQVRWHPDKFLQKCGNRLCAEDREQIIEQVKELSQEINAILESEF